MEIATNQFFECIYLLESPVFYLIEIKRNDLGEFSAISEKFKWLKIVKQDLSISEMTFRSMDSSEQVEERYFEEGFLKFSKKSGTFIEKYNSAQHLLEHIPNELLPNEVFKEIETLLASKLKTEQSLYLES